MRLSEIRARKILNSQGNWTIETTVILDNGALGVASVPAGISFGKYEAVCIPVEKGIEVINGILREELRGCEVNEIKDIDRELIFLDGTENKEKLGANTILSISIASTKALAYSASVPLYRYIDTVFNSNFPKLTNHPRLPKILLLVMEGGKHGYGKLKMQEFSLIVDDVESALVVNHLVENELSEAKLSFGIGKEGGFCPDIPDDEALKILSRVSKTPIALDVAAIHQSENGGRKSDNLKVRSFGPVSSYIEKYPIALVEDSCGEDDWEKWSSFMKVYGSRVLVVADDLSVTNVERLKRIIKDRLAGGVVVKPNQIGTITETLEFSRMAKDAGLKLIVSHRGEDTNDDFIADFATGIGADYVKFGGLRRGERIAKYNRLLEIGAELVGGTCLNHAANLA